MLQATIRNNNGTWSTGDYTTRFTSAIQLSGRMISARMLQNSIEVYNDINIKSANIYYDCNLLKSTMKIAEIELIGLYFLNDYEYEIQLGVSPNNGITFYYVSYGNFKVISCERNLDSLTTKLVLYDDMVKAMEPYNLSLTYPMTNKQFFNAIANAIGLNVGLSIPSTNVMALSRKVETYTNSYTYRDVLDDFAEILGGVILVKNGTLELRVPTAISGELDEEQLINIKTQNQFGSVSNIVLARTPQEDNVHYPATIGSGEIIRIEDNQLVESNVTEDVNNRTVYLQPIYNSISTWPSYYAVELESYGYLLYEPCDLLTYSFTNDNNETTTFQTLWLSDNITFEQGIKENMTCELYKGNETDLSKSTSESRKDRETYMYVDKVTGQIVTHLESVESTVETASSNASTALTNSTTAINTANRATKLTATNYAVSASGTVTPSSWPYSSIPSVSPGQYLWTRETYKDGNNNTSYVYSVSYQGANGQNGQDGHDGQDGQDGQDGLSLKSATPLWYLKDANMSFELKGNTSQSGTPTPTAPAFINTVRNENDVAVIYGKNLFDEVFRQGNGSKITTANRCFADSNYYITSGQTYTFSTDMDTNTYRFAIGISESMFPSAVALFDSGWKRQASYTFTASASGYLGVGISRVNDANFTPSEIASIHWQLEKGSTATAYEPYDAHSYSLTLGGRNMVKPYDSSESKQGITCTYNAEEQSWTFNGTCDLDNTTFSYTTEHFNIDKNVTTVRAYWVSGSVTEYCTLRAFDSAYVNSISFDLTTLSANNRVISQKHTGNSFTTNSCTIRFNNGSVATNFKIKIMIANDNDLTYEPYISEKVNNLNQQDYLSNGFLPQTGAFPTNNTSYPNAQYFLVDMERGETLVLKGSTSNQGRIRVIQDGVVKEGFIQTDTYARTNTSFSSGFREGYITALQNLQFGIMFLNGWQNSGGSDLVVYKQTYNGTNPIELCKIGTVKDYIYQSGNKWYVHKAISNFTLNGTESWWVENAGTSNWFYAVNNIKSIDIITDSTSSNMICDHYPFGSVGGSNTNQGMYIVKTQKQVRIRWNTEDTARNFKTWLGKNNVTVYYVREYPFEIEITSPTLLEELSSLSLAMNGGPLTSVSQVNDGSKIDLTYNTDFSIPSIPSELVTTQEDSPDVWTLIQPSYILGYRYYSLSQIIYEDDTFSFTDVLTEDGITSQAYQIETNQLKFIKTTTKLSNDIVETNAGTVQTLQKEIEKKISDAKGSITEEYKEYYSTQIETTAQGIDEQFIVIDGILNDPVTGLQTQVDDLNTVIHRDANGITISSTGNAGVTIKQEGGTIRGQFTANSLDFIGNGQKLAWVNATDGLGGRKLSLASNPSESSRWNITPNGEHLTFTRHNN